MDRCPAEICSEIFANACMDNGYTGRSLSLVSKYIRETSRPIMLQSISVIGYQQLIAFASMLENTAECFRQVRYVFISAHARSTESDPKALTPEYARREKAYAAFERILTAISPCVQILHAFFIFYRPFALLPVSLPSLVELTLHGPLEGSAAIDERIQLPSLQHLHLTSFYSPHYVFEHIVKLTPSLLHLRISAPDHSESFVNELQNAFASSEGKLPGQLKSVFIHSPTEPNNNWLDMMDIYERTMVALTRMTREFHFLRLLPPLRIGLFRTVSIDDAETAWLNSIRGRGWWL